MATEELAPAGSASIDEGPPKTIRSLYQEFYDVTEEANRIRGKLIRPGDVSPRLAIARRRDQDSKLEQLDKEAEALAEELRERIATIVSEEARRIADVYTGKVDPDSELIYDCVKQLVEKRSPGEHPDIEFVASPQALTDISEDFNGPFAFTRTESRNQERVTAVRAKRLEESFNGFLPVNLRSLDGATGLDHLSNVVGTIQTCSTNIPSSSGLIRSRIEGPARNFGTLREEIARIVAKRAGFMTDETSTFSLLGEAMRAGAIGITRVGRPQHRSWNTVRADSPCFVLISPEHVEMQEIDGSYVAHNENGPAVTWRDGEEDWFWKGVRIDKQYIEDPDNINLQVIIGEGNVEVKQAMLDLYGVERLIDSDMAHVVDKDEYNGDVRRLIRVITDERRIDEDTGEVDISDARFWDDRTCVTLVHVTCPSTGREYMLRVPPNTETAREAVAWTFERESDTYAPDIET